MTLINVCVRVGSVSMVHVRIRGIVIMNKYRT